MSVKLVLPKGSALSYAARLLAEKCGGAAAVVEEDTATQLPALNSFLRSLTAVGTATVPVALPVSKEDAALQNQWLAVAVRLASTNASINLSLAELEANYFSQHFVNSSEFLCDPSKISAADLFMFSAVRGVAAGSASVSHEAPNLTRWLQFMEKQPVVQELVAAAPHLAAAAAAAATDAPKTGGKKGEKVYAIPSQEEIERKRLEKEKRKAAEAAAKAAGGQDATAAKADAGGAKKKEKELPLAQSPTDAVTGLDIRVGRIIDIRRHPEADKLYIETIQVGPAVEDTRTIVSGLVEHYTPEQLLNQLVCILANMKAKPLRGVSSHGMVLCASSPLADSPDANGARTVEIIHPPADAVPGTRISFGETPVPAEFPPLHANLFNLLADLTTNDSGAVIWKDQPMFATTPSGRHAVVANELKNVPVK